MFTRHDQRGAAFRVWPGGAVQVLHHFGPAQPPVGGLTLARDGQYLRRLPRAVAPTTWERSSRCLRGGGITNLDDFTGGSDGAHPYRRPDSERERRFLRNHRQGVRRYGSVYRITRYGNFTLLHTFNGTRWKRTLRCRWCRAQTTTSTELPVRRVVGWYGTIFRVSSTGDFKVL